MKKSLFAIVFILWIAPVCAQLSELETKLESLPDITFTKIKTLPGFEACYEIQVTQPIDHLAPKKGSFTQKVFLSHRGYEQPTVMVTEGYANSSNGTSELAVLLKANQLDIEHRYFGESQPKDIDYQYLTLEQATADLHHINLIFKQLYNTNWISTGISKGGQTTIFYRYFYPEDVDVSVPYVAPLNLEFEDKRIYSWLRSIGTEACRNRTLAYQKSLLEDRKKLLPKVAKLTKKENLTFSYFNLEEAYEFAVLEFPFSLWQWGHGCENVPDADASKKERLAFLDKVSGFDFWADAAMATYGSHYYQAASQMGYYGYETEDFEGLLKALPMQPHPHAAFTPNKMEVVFDGSLLPNVFDWLQTEAGQFIYIYGADDTWSATGVPESDRVDAHWFIMQGKHHGNARIRNMDPEDRSRLVDALEGWLGLDIE